MNMSAQRQAFEAWWHDNCACMKWCSPKEAEVIWQAAISQQAPVSAEPIDEFTIKALLLEHDPVGVLKGGYIVQAVRCVVNAALAQSRAQVVPAEPVVNIDAAIQWIEDRRANYIGEHGYSDPDTGALEYGRGSHAQAKEEYVGELEEIIEGLRELKDDAAPAVSEPAETSVVNQSLTTAAAPSAPIEPTLEVLTDEQIDAMVWTLEGCMTRASQRAIVRAAIGGKSTPPAEQGEK